MPFLKAALLALLLVFPGFTLAEEAEDAPEMHVMTEEAAADEPPEMGLTPEKLLKLHAKADADGNGKLSMDEILQFLHTGRKSASATSSKPAMELMDGNKDGKISLEELLQDMTSEEGHEEQKVREVEKFKVADGNNDGLLDEMEFAAFSNPDLHDHVLQVAARHTMEDRDRDHDGFLTFDEWWNDENVQADGEDMQTFKQLDKDGSGKLDLKELLAWESGHVHTAEAMESFMQHADKDKDQHMTLEELQEAHGGDDEHDTKIYFVEMAQHHEL